MRQFFFFFLTLCLLPLFLFSQAYEGTVTYDKKKQMAIVIDYEYSPQAVENAVIDKIKKMGNKAREEKGLFNSDKGFIVFKNASIPDINNQRLDYIIKVERKSRREKDESTLYLAINGENNSTITDMDAYDVGKVKAFLNNLLPEIEEASLELEIEAQEEVVAKAEKKLKDLKDDQESMEKKIKDLESDLKKNAEAQEKQQKELEGQKDALETLKRKRRSA